MYARTYSFRPGRPFRQVRAGHCVRRVQARPVCAQLYRPSCSRRRRLRRHHQGEASDKVQSGCGCRLLAQELLPDLARSGLPSARSPWGNRPVASTYRQPTATAGPTAASPGNLASCKTTLATPTPLLAVCKIAIDVRSGGNRWLPGPLSPSVVTPRLRCGKPLCETTPCRMTNAAVWWTQLLC
jgi:hypothetical protein